MAAKSFLTVWLVDESQNDVELLGSTLRNAGHRIRSTQIRRRKDLREHLDGDLPDLVLCAADVDAIDLGACATLIAEADASIPVVGVAAEVTTAAVAAAIQAGARDLVARSATGHLQQVVARELAARQRALQLAEAQRAAREARQQSDSFLDATSDAVAFITEGIHAGTNAAYARAFGYELPAQVEGLPFMDFIASSCQGKIRDLLRTFDHGETPGRGPYAVEAQRIDGSTFPAQLYLAGVSLDGERSLQVLIPAAAGSAETRQTLDQLRERYARLERKYQILTVEHAKLRRAGREHAAGEALEETRRAMHRAEQELPVGAPAPADGRQRFISLLDQRLREEAPTRQAQAVVCIRLDAWSRLVRDFGFRAVDGFMERMEQIVHGQLDAGELLEHCGDGMLAVFLQRPGMPAVDQWLERVHAAIRAEMFEADGRSRHVACSVGARPVTELTGAAPGELLREAYALVLDASAAGGNRVAGSKTAAASGAVEDSDEAWSIRLRGALDQGAFEVVYQPVAALDGSAPGAYEVRLRLPDATGEMSGSMDFRGPAERGGLIPEIDRWVVERTLRMIREQAEIRPGTEFFIQLGGATLREAGLMDWARQAVDEARRHGMRLMFEVAQTVAENHVKITARLGNLLAELESGLVLDRFGVSDGSAPLLDQIPVAYVKLDDSYMNDLYRNAPKRDRFGELVRAAHDRGIRSIAGHVEDAQALAVLWQLGVNFIQGNYVQEPEVVLASSEDFQWQAPEPGTP